MNGLPIRLAILLLASAVSAQQPSPTNPPAQQSPPVAQSQGKQSPTHKTEFFSDMGANSIFIYRTDVDPCGPVPDGLTLLPLGSGFVVQILKKGSPTVGKTTGWSFLITAKHVLANQAAVIVRVNADNQTKFICKKIEMTSRSLAADDGIDLEALLLPEIEGYTPTVVPTSALGDKSKMEEWNIGVGTEVVTIGYLYGYSGLKANYPVAKFGHISMVSDESWYLNTTSNLMEQGYIMDLPNAPGLSGAPVFSFGTEFEANPFRYREVPVLVVGVVKGLMLVPVGDAKISQGVAVVEPGSHVRELIVKIASVLKNEGMDVEPVK